MKKFIVSVLSISIFFIGLGSLVDNVGAKFKSDEKALALIEQARQAIGGDANIKNVLSLSAVGKATKTFNFEGAQKSEQGDWELNMQFPNKLGKMMKLRTEDKGTGDKTGSFDRKVVVINKSEGDKIIVRNGEELPKEGTFTIRKRSSDDKGGQTEETGTYDIKRVAADDELRSKFDKMEQNDLFRTTFSLLLTAPQGIEAEYIYAGEGSVDGNSCDIIEARNGGSSVKLFLDKSSHLPRMLSYTDAKPMMFFFKMKKDDAANTEENGDVKTFQRKLEAPQSAEYQIKFSDYRSVNGVLLPHVWTQTVEGRADETIEISGYEINPANIAEKFNNMPKKTMIRKAEKQ